LGELRAHSKRETKDQSENHSVSEPGEKTGSVNTHKTGDGKETDMGYFIPVPEAPDVGSQITDREQQQDEDCNYP